MAYSYTVKPTDSGGLNSIVQKLGFSNYKDAGVAAVPSGNFDLIRAGDVINIGNYDQPVQQTTTQMRTVATENGAKLDEALARVTGNKTDTTEKPAVGTVTVTRDMDNGDGTRTVTYSDGKTARVTATKNADGTESYKELNAMDIVQNDIQQGKQEADDRAKARVQYAEDTMDSIQAKSSPGTSALIDSIKKTYGARIALMEASNKRVLGAKEQAGIRSGRSKYMNDVHQGILSDEEQQGLARASELEGQMLSLISQAEAARNDKDLETFNSVMGQYDEAAKAMQTEVQNIQKNAYEKLKAMQDADKAALDKAKTEQDMALAKSERAAPALATAMAGLSSAEEQAAFVLKYSKRTGIDPEIILGDIEAYAKMDEKAKLDLENVRNTITNRNASTAIAAERLALDKKKADFSPTEDQKAKVNVYLSKNGDDEDKKRAKDDPDFFYFVLGKAQDEEL